MLRCLRLHFSCEWWELVSFFSRYFWSLCECLSLGPSPFCSYSVFSLWTIRVLFLCHPPFFSVCCSYASPKPILLFDFHRRRHVFLLCLSTRFFSSRCRCRRVLPLRYFCLHICCCFMLITSSLDLVDSSVDSWSSLVSIDANSFLHLVCF